MPQTSVKLIWSISSCNFCPRSDVRTCQIKPGKLLSKLSSALDMDECMLDSSEGICTCCLADVDMIIRSVAIRGAMKDYYLDMVQHLRRGYKYANNNFYNGQYEYKSGTSTTVVGQEQLTYPVEPKSELSVDPVATPLPPTLVARPPFTKKTDSTELLKASPVIAAILPTPSAISNKKAKEKLTRYQCILCDKIAGSKSHCMEHLICHSPVRPFTCSHCMKTYKSRKACREHLIVMHGVEKVEENLQKLVLVDHEALRQLDSVCTQYRKIYNQGSPKRALAPVSPSSYMMTHLKTEFENTGCEVGAGAAWLYKPIAVEPSRLPPPLLQCMPSSSSLLPSPVLAAKSPTLHDETPPPKRTRKGKPHKLVHIPATEEPTPDTLEPELVEPEVHELGCLTESNDDVNSPKESELPDAVSNPENDVFFQSPGATQSDSSITQPYFPSFQTYKTEPSLSTPNRFSPTGMIRRIVPPCPMCNRTFPTKEKMADHMRSHSQIKQFSCRVCNRFFKYRRGVTNHLKEVHHMTNRSDIKTKVASHEVGCIMSKSSRRKRKTKIGCKQDTEEQGTRISPKTIQDTLSSLADIQHAADSTYLPLQLSSEESSTDPDDHSSCHEAPFTTDNSIMSLNETPLLSSVLDCKSDTTGATPISSSELNPVPLAGCATTADNSVHVSGAINSNAAASLETFDVNL